MSASDLDRMHLERVNGALNGIFEGDDDAFDNLILSERVVEELDDPKIFLHSFNVDAILSYIPYSDKIYVGVCPVCISGSSVEPFKKLVECGSIVPVFGGAYRYYDEDVVDFASTRDHVSGPEFSALRTLFAGNGEAGRVCGHCIGVREKRIRALMARRKGMHLDSDSLKLIIRNLDPYLGPDFFLLDQFEEALRRKDAESAEEIISLSWVVSNMRTAETFSSPLILEGEQYANMPAGIDGSLTDTAGRATLMRKRIADGVGLRIPTDMPIEQYVEIASDFRPRIAAAMDRAYSDVGETTDSASIQREIMHLNDEVNRVRNSKRHIALSAVVDFYRNNQTIMNAALVAGALSLADGVLGCAAGATTGALGWAKEKGLVGSGPALDRVQRIAGNIAGEHLDGLIAKYVGASSSAVSIVSLKRDLHIS